MDYYNQRWIFCVFRLENGKHPTQSQCAQSEGFEIILRKTTKYTMLLSHSKPPRGRGGGGELAPVSSEIYDPCEIPDHA